jgi:hypothetical protein
LEVLVMASVVLPTAAGQAKQRRKLQKPPVTKRRNSWFLGRKSGTSLNLLPPSQDTLAAPPQSTPKLSLPIDLSDSKWFDFLQKSSRSNSKHPTPLATPAVEKCPSVVPELAHLAIEDTRPSISANTLSHSAGSSDLSIARRRRQAKTPVHSIGQLERERDNAPPLPRPSLDARRDSALILGQEYRDLLMSRNGYLADKQSLRDSSSDEDLPGYITPSAIPYNTNNLSDSGSSPTSSTSGRTLLGYQPEAVFFKPYAFSREESRSSMLSQASNTTRSPARGQPTHGSPSFQLCLELLGRELSTAVGHQHHRTGSSTSALQVLLMIEAYERLRDQLIAEAQRQPFGRGMQDARQVEAMFDMWLRSLYAVHDRLMGEAHSRWSESDYGAFESEGL